MIGKPIQVKILRYSPEHKGKKIEKFEIPYSSGMTVQILLRHIFENIDPTLAFRDFRCGRGSCNACLIKVNGKVKKSCETAVHIGQEVLLEPASDRVIKDLVIQFD